MYRCARKISKIIPEHPHWRGRTFPRVLPLGAIWRRTSTIFALGGPAADLATQKNLVVVDDDDDSGGGYYH